MTPAGGVAKQARAGFQAFPYLSIFLALCADSLTNYERSESSRERCVIENLEGGEERRGKSGRGCVSIFPLSALGVPSGFLGSIPVEDIVNLGSIAVGGSFSL